MSALPQVWTNLDEIDARLQSLGLDRPLLLEAARRGLAAFAACTPHHPRNFPALASWAETMRGLRDQLAVIPYRWSSVEENGQPQVHNPGGTIALTVAGGDKNTGKLGEAEPRTSSSKGYTTSRAMARNAFLFPEMEQDEQEKLDRTPRCRRWRVTL
jgi:hypothetical protein